MDTIALRYKRRAERYPDEDEEERWNGVALDFYLRTGHVPDDVLRYKERAIADDRALKYSENQPRVPAGNPDGGQWTAEGGSGGENSGEGGEGSPFAEPKKTKIIKLAQVAERGYLISQRMTPDGRLCRYVFSFGVLEGPGSDTFGCLERPFASAVSHYRLLPLNDNIIQKGTLHDYAR